MSDTWHGAEGPFVFLHVGDLHVTQLDLSRASSSWQERERQLRQDLCSILAEIDGIHDHEVFDFVYLPGDLAENGRAEEYDFLAKALARHGRLKVRLIPGDHDRQLGKASLERFARFRAGLSGHQRQPHPVSSKVECRFTDDSPPCKPSKKRVQQFYFCDDIKGVRCLFLDTVSAGRGQKGWGLDFRLGLEQTKWLRREVARARADRAPCVVFMHCYPSDMHQQDDRAEIASLFWDGQVRLVEMGHTHYNQIAHDGRTTYAAARSVGQNEDGPTGYAVVALDRNVTSWRFKQLQLPWPFVMITSPADRRLATEALDVDHDGRIRVRALVLSDRRVDHDHCDVICQVDNGLRHPMRFVGGNMFEALVTWPAGARTLSVQVRDDRTCGKDHLDQDTIEPAMRLPDFRPTARPERLGSPDATVGGWSAKGVRGDPQGPNNGGHQW